MHIQLEVMVNLLYLWIDYVCHYDQYLIHHSLEALISGGHLYVYLIPAFQNAFLTGENIEATNTYAVNRLPCFVNESQV